MQVLAHNLLAQYGRRELNMTSDKKAKSCEKLSSGYRINRSADDAAGLSISEKMRAQIRGLNRASANIQDGISLCQVADGALNETHEILQRMRELSVQAANDTNQEIDRAAIQSEIDELTAEVDRIANGTSFNDGIYPLKKEHAEDVTNIDTSNQNGTWQLPDVFYSKNWEVTVASIDASAIVDGVTYAPGQSVTVPILGFQVEHGGKTYYSHHLDVKGDVYGADYYNNYRQILSDTEERGVYILAGTSIYFSTRVSDLKIEQDTGYVYLMSKNSNEKVYFYEERSATDAPVCFGSTTDPSTLGSRDFIISGVKKSGQGTQQDQQPIMQPDGIWIQAGANAMEGLSLELVDATAKGIGIIDPTLDVMSYEQAGTSISRLDAAIDQVSGYRSRFGAYQNRLEHAMAVDDNTAENTQHAESVIRDTDMAQEMLELSRRNILEQAGQSVLVQANQMSANVLQLLQ